MKNTHLIPTDKPSRLFEIFQFNFIFDNENKYSEEYKKNHKYKNKNIYIASNENPKANVYCLINGVLCKTELLNDKIVSRQLSGGATMDICKSEYSEIILTDNKDLIKDGVQGIDNEFLEWFVMNPSCEEVEIIKQHQYHSSKEFYIDADYVNCSKEQYESIKEEIPNCSLRILYKIIIPNEEPKQDWFCPKCDSYVSSESVTFEETHQTCNTGVVIKEPKQETTLDEAAERYSQGWDKGFLYSITSINAFKAGAEWEAKRRYSEEEVFNLCRAFATFVSHKDPSYKKQQEWFEQFKKK